LNEFLLKRVGKTWEEALELDAKLKEINNEAVDEFKNEAIRSKRYPIAQSENDLINLFTNLKLCKNNILKRSALLVFGKDPRDYLINAFVKIGKFGQSDTELIFQEVIESNAFQLADKTIEVLDKKYFKRSISYKGLNRIETPEYPYEAIREALLNAIIHRNYFGPPIQISIYDDKFIIWNPGLLPEELTIEDLKKKHSSYPRNPVIADVFFKAGLIETWGKGTLKIIEACQNAGLPEPKFEILTGGIAVTFNKDRFSEQFLFDKELNKRQIKAINHIKEKNRITNKEYQLINNCSRNTATNDLKDMVKKYILKPSDISGAGSFYELI
jgi:ATP-dependent DNA helicase RecG